MFAVIVQNDESQWDDVKGDLYHYPSKYKAILEPGCLVIYYTGRARNKGLKERLTDKPHYFGIGVIGDSVIDPENQKNLYCEVLNYQEFNNPIIFKDSKGQYLEDIPETKKSNYWRSGVRKISEENYRRILSGQSLTPGKVALPSQHTELESMGIIEGTKKIRYSAYYERNPFYRNKAIEIHGLACMVCGFDFEATYGALGRGYIHVHHNKPVSESGPTKIDPKTDMSVLCPNCHAMVHRKRDKTFSVKELQQICSQ